MAWCLYINSKYGEYYLISVKMEMIEDKWHRIKREDDMKNWKGHAKK